MKTATRKSKLLFVLSICFGVLLSSSFAANQVFAQTKKSAAKKTTAKKAATKNPKFSDYVLTADQLFKMPAQDQVNYMLFLQKLVAQVEVMQEVRTFESQKNSKKNKSKSSAQFLFEQFFNPVVAETSYRKVGNYCLYGGHPSKYEQVAAGYLRCKPQGLGSCPRISGKEAVECNPVLFSRAVPDGSGDSKLCVQRVPQNYNPQTGTPGITERCVQAFELKIGGRAGGGVQEVINARLGEAQKNPEERERWKSFFNELKKSFDSFETEIGDNNINFAQYCGPDLNNALNSGAKGGRQAEECRAIGRLIGNFEDRATTAPEIPRGPAESTVRARCIQTPIPCQGPPVDHQAECLNNNETPKELACALCSISSTLGGGNYENWLSFLALGAQMHGSKENLKTPAGQKALLARVADMVDAYGVCDNEIFKLKENLIGNSTIRDFVDGTKTPKKGNFFSTSSDERAIVNYYGLHDLRGITFFNQLFNDKNFENSSLIERRLRFQQALKSNGYGPETSALYPKAGYAPIATCANKLVADIDYSPLTQACLKTSDWDPYKHRRGVERDVRSQGVEVVKPNSYQLERLQLSNNAMTSTAELSIGSNIRQACGIAAQQKPNYRYCPTSTIDMSGGGGDGGSAGAPTGAGEGPGSGPGAAGPGAGGAK